MDGFVKIYLVVGGFYWFFRDSPYGIGNSILQPSPIIEGATCGQVVEHSREKGESWSSCERNNVLERDRWTKRLDTKLSRKIREKKTIMLDFTCSSRKVFSIHYPSILSYFFWGAQSIYDCNKVFSLEDLSPPYTYKILWGAPAIRSIVSAMLHDEILFQFFLQLIPGFWIL